MKRFYTLFVISLALSSLMNFASAQDESTWMPDADLRTAVRKNLRLADDAALTQANILNLTKLRAADKGISDLTGIEHATNLTTARLAGNSISDLSPISGLTQLTSLRLQRNQVSEISALSNLTGLTQLLLWDNQISNVEPLTNLTNLVELKLAGNPITDAAPLASLPNLIDIDITIPDPPQEDPPQNDPPPPETPADVDPPGVSVSGFPSDVQNGAFDVTITFTEAVSDFEQSDVSLTGTATATITAWSSNTDNTTYTATITPTTSGTVTLSIAAGVATDAASNPNTAATIQTINVDINAPSVSISVPSEDQTSAFDATITFTEAVSDFVQSDVSLSGTANASITSWSANTENTVYTATITPGTSGTVSVSVPAGVATDAASNPNTASGTQTVTVFVSQPQQVITTVCNRTSQVRDAIVAAVLGIDDCANVTQTHLAAITTLTLTYDDITALQVGDFDGLSSLEELYVIGNPLTSLPEDIFDGLTSLKVLHLQNNKLSSLPEDVFDGLSALTDLRVFNNQLSSLPEDLFDGLSSLEILLLVHNQLSSLPEDIFDGLSALRLLYVFENRLTSLPEDVFDGLSSLKELYLSSNKLNGLPADVFDGLSALVNLTLHSTGLSSLPADIFDGLSTLGLLYLHYNQLSSLPEDLFDGLSSLKYLHLNHNQLSSLPDGIFEGLSSLNELHLDDNSVDPLPVTVSLEKAGTAIGNQFKAVAPVGAPFDIVLPLNVTNASLSGGASSITISIGSLESEPITVTRTPGTTGAVTVDIGDPLPGLPNRYPKSHNGYTLVKSTDLPLEVISSVPAAPGLGIASLLDPATLKTLDPETLEAKLDTLLAESDGSLRYLQAIALLESVLAEMRPEETLLLANYPNPFNPETWIPYHLEDTSDVQITIYNARGTVVRRLDIGHQRAGYYTSRSRAAHWDGRNDIGERVATGIYFYQLQAGNVSFLRKMVILK